MTEWVWVDADVALAAHREQLLEHGGGNGVRDLALLESALARPCNLASYGEPDAASLAAAYAFGIARNHPFVDGHKRTAAVVSETFLIVNGFSLDTDNAEVAVVFEDLAASEINEEELADWFRTRIRPA